MRFFLIFIWTILFGNLAMAQISPGGLSQAHRELEGINNCTKCHSFGQKVMDQKCLDCHVEIQSLVNEDRGYHVSEEVKSKTCIDCHSEHHGLNFNLDRFDQDLFNHDLTGYKLKGAHQEVDCKECHKTENISDLKTQKLEGTFLGMGTACLDCHEDYHQGTLDNDCIQCHTLEKWRPAELFDHNDSDFKLLGAHQKVDCKECHMETTLNERDFQEFTGIEFSNCVDCHDDVHEGSFGIGCTDCHNEGSWKTLNSGNKFDHNLTDFPLKGLHVGVDCKACHTSGNNTTSLAFQRCLDCHDDYHEDEFSNLSPKPDCNECHLLTEPFTFTTFGIERHQESDFELVDAHLATPCFSCHLSEDRWDFRDVGERCVDCHEDIHQGFISEQYYPNSDCKECHQADTWQNVSFDHSKTNWKLEGAHDIVNCRECHFKTELTSTDQNDQQFYGLNTSCTTCHENIHGEQFGPPGEVDCASCHTPSKNWDAENFDHQISAFPLEGKHAEIDCKACHFSKLYEGGVNRVEYKIQKFECRDCHSS